MRTTPQGTIRLFRFAGVDLFLHWSWFIVAVIEINIRSKSYSSIAWNVMEYLALFVIVMVHEYGHALACRQVGGTANQIVLWPLGGVAYVNPPPRPGATLWSIAAGPLVNVGFLVVLSALGMLNRATGWMETMPDAHAFLHILWVINLGLLIFNMLPIYPLDGGQILRSLLWFVIGRARSLMVATVIGVIGGVGFIAYAYWQQSAWLGFIALFMLMNCWGGFQQARVLLRQAKLPRREGLACPACKTGPPVGTFWKCGRCGQSIDIFQTPGVCPNCSAPIARAQCLDCRTPNSMSDWVVGSYSRPTTPPSTARAG